MTGLRGLTARWSLREAPTGIEETLADYVAESSHARFSGMEGLGYKTWRMVAGEWFEGCYVFDSDEARTRFQADFEAVAAESPVSKLVGSAPVLIEPCQVVAVAEGASGFAEQADGR